MSQMRFFKGYLPEWTEKLFQIALVFQDSFPYYKNQKRRVVGRNILSRGFTKNVQKKNNVFRIECVLQ